MDLTTGEAAGQCSKDAMISELKRQLAATLEITKQLMTVKELQELQLMLHHTKQGSSALTLHPPRMDAPSTVLGAADRQAAIPPPPPTEETALPAPPPPSTTFTHLEATGLKTYTVTRRPDGPLHCDGVLSNMTAFALLDLNREPTNMQTILKVWPGGTPTTH